MSSIIAPVGCCFPHPVATLEHRSAQTQSLQLKFDEVSEGGMGNDIGENLFRPEKWGFSFDQKSSEVADPNGALRIDPSEIG